MVSEKKRKSNKRWDDANRERVNYLKKRSASSSFVKIAELEDLQVLKKLINEREEFLKNETNTSNI